MHIRPTHTHYTYPGAGECSEVTAIEDLQFPFLPQEGITVITL